MKKIILCIEFKGGKGYCFITLLGTDYEIIKAEKSDCYEFRLSPGTYDILCQGVSPAGGTVVVVTDAAGKELGRKEIKKEGYFSKKITIVT